MKNLLKYDIKWALNDYSNKKPDKGGVLNQHARKRYPKLIIDHTPIAADESKLLGAELVKIKAEADGGDDRSMGYLHAAFVYKSKDGKERCLTVDAEIPMYDDSFLNVSYCEDGNGNKHRLVDPGLKDMVWESLDHFLEEIDAAKRDTSSDPVPALNVCWKNLQETLKKWS